MIYKVESMLQKKLWVIITTNVREIDPEALQRHLAHQVKLEKQGIMFGAGPVYDTKGKREYGMVIVRADSVEDATIIADSDPMHRDGFRTYTLHRWTLNEGRFNVTVNFSDGTYVFD